MLGIAKKVYNGVTDQRFFRLLVLVSIPLINIELAAQVDDIQGVLSSMPTSSQLEQEFKSVRQWLWDIDLDSEAMRDSISEIKQDLFEIRIDTRDIDRNTGRIPY